MLSVAWFACCSCMFPSSSVGWHVLLFVSKRTVVTSSVPPEKRVVKTPDQLRNVRCEREVNVVVRWLSSRSSGLSGSLNGH
jgi:hypothetical protein